MTATVDSLGQIVNSSHTSENSLEANGTQSAERNQSLGEQQTESVQAGSLLA